MHRLKFVLLLFASTYGYSVFAQADFNEVDTTTYNQYLRKEWKPLIKYGTKAAKNGLDYYYLNIRLGIAHYNKFHYYKSIKYLDKALKNNPESDDAKELLFWSHYLTGSEKDAADVYKSMTPEGQQRINYHPKRLVESLYAEGGAKISDNSAVAKTLGYFQFGINHKFSPAFSIYHAYTFQTQKQIWGHYTQHQYYFAPTVHFKKHLALNIDLHYSHYSGVLDFIQNIPDHSPAPANPGGQFIEDVVARHITKNGTYKENLLLAQVSISKTIKGFTIEPHVGFFLNFLQPNYIDAHHDTIHRFFHNGPNIIRDSTFTNFGQSIVNKKETKYEILFGANLAYDFGRFTIGADVNVVINDSVKTATVTPWAKLILCKKAALRGYFMYKSNYPIALFEGSQLYNGLDKIKYKGSLTGEIYPVKKLTLYLTYQFEGIRDSFSSNQYVNNDYNLHTLLIGLNLKL